MTYPANFRTAAQFGILALLALAVRLPHLSARPMHTDESVNAYITGELLAGEPFRYDARDRHGPALSAFAWLIARAFGTLNFQGLTEDELRMGPVLAGTATVLLFFAGCRLLGSGVSLVAAGSFAFTALPVYYSRYFIHETLFVAATLALILSVLKTVKSNSFGAAGFAGLSAGLMLACKETAVLHLLALAISGSVIFSKDLDRRFAKSAIFATAIFLVFALISYSWFGRDWNGLNALLHGASGLLRRAAGEGHEKPFWYYFLLLGGGWSGAILLLLGAIGIVRTFQASDNPWRQTRAFIAVYAVLITAIYCAIPYKTPWLALNIWLPLSIMGGVGVEWLWTRCVSYPRRLAFCVGASILVVSVAHDTWLRVFVRPADETNPFAYSQTVTDLLRLEPRISQLTRERKLTSPRIAVVAADPWPLPWYLRKYPNVGFWQPDQATGPADFYITSQDGMTNPGAQLQHCRQEFFGIRPDTLVVLWIPEPAVPQP